MPWPLYRGGAFRCVIPKLRAANRIEVRPERIRVTKLLKFVVLNDMAATHADPAAGVKVFCGKEAIVVLSFALACGRD